MNREENESLLLIVQEFGKLYWEPYGVRGAADFRENMRHWRNALKQFLSEYAYERAGASPHYGPSASQAVEGEDSAGTPDASGCEERLWTHFKKNLGITSGNKGANARLNPLTPGKNSVIRFLRKHASKADYNIGRWARESLEQGSETSTRGTHRKLCEIRGVGPKIAAFFLRDIAVAFDIDQVKTHPLLQPIDRWTRWGAQVLSGETGSQRRDSHWQEVLAQLGQDFDIPVDPLLVNTGLWFLGADFSQGPEDFKSALDSRDKLKQMIHGSLLRLKLTARNLDEREKYIRQSIPGLENET